MMKESRYLCFTLGKEDFGVPLLAVREVIALPDITPIPHSPPHFLGIINLRGQILSIVDLRSKLGIASKNHSETCVLVSEIDGVQLGLVVDSVNSVLSPEPDSVSEKPGLEGTKAANYVSAVFRTKDRLILFLDLSKILDVNEIKKLRAPASAVA